MDSDERPAKIRKISPQEQDLNAQVPGLLDSKEKNEQRSIVLASDETSNSNINVEPEKDPESVIPVLRDDTNNEPEDPPLSKNQQKKLRKKQEWESKREDRKVVRKEKAAAKRERLREQRRKENPEGQPELADAVASAPRLPPPKAIQLPITFMIDCDFDDLMRDNERISLASQITRSYSDNKNSIYRAHLAICSFSGKLRERFQNVLIHYKGWRGVRWLDESFEIASEKAKSWMLDDQKGGALDGVFSKYANLDEAGIAKLKSEGEIVYLSSDGDEDLTELKPYSTYIIGGLVDKNREKGICYKRAKSKGIRTARLPIGEYLDMASRKILATNHVNEIMVKWLECGDWGESFLKAIPKRKGGVLKGQRRDDEEDDDVSETAKNEPDVSETNGVDGEKDLVARSLDISGTPDSAGRSTQDDGKSTEVQT